MDDEVFIEDPIVWERMTVGHLRTMLDDMVRNGNVSDDTLVVVDSDPEGNGLHPVRQAWSVGTIEFSRSGQIEEFNDSDDKPAATLWLGVGY